MTSRKKEKIFRVAQSDTFSDGSIYKKNIIMYKKVLRIGDKGNK